ncbi:MAG: hypothetical protein ACI4TM_06265 [Candidatus Cryptobacteroides sp.]
MASAPQSNGVTKAYSKAVMIGSPPAIVEEAIDIKADYEAVHGAVINAAPKVFLCYFFVNSKTGKKSGEMVGQISLYGVPFQGYPRPPSGWRGFLFQMIPNSRNYEHRTHNPDTDSSPGRRSRHRPVLHH